jgi:hypothetical protein
MDTNSQFSSLQCSGRRLKGRGVGMRGMACLVCKYMVRVQLIMGHISYENVATFKNFNILKKEVKP